MADRLFDVDDGRWHGTRALVVQRQCPNCQAPYTTTEHVQPALFIHGGYGAARKVVVRSCACPGRSVASLTAVSPRTPVRSARTGP